MLFSISFQSNLHSGWSLIRARFKAYSSKTKIWQKQNMSIESEIFLLMFVDSGTFVSVLYMELERKSYIRCFLNAIYLFASEVIMYNDDDIIITHDDERFMAFLLLPLPFPKTQCQEN